MYCVYKHVCPNEKVYIGITGNNPLKRWNNGRGYNGNKYFYKAILKYGWENIKHEILFEGLTKEEACEKEVELIAAYKSNNPQYGYNLSSGGESGSYGIKYTFEQRIRMSETRKGGKRYEQARLNIANGKKGDKNPNWHKHPTQETIEKCRISSMKENLSAETREKLSNSHKKPIVCVELNIVYDSSKTAEKQLGILATSICKVLKGVKNHKTAGGYHWEYKKEKI